MTKKKISKKTAVKKTPKPKQVKLPNKLSDLIEVALADLDAVERSSKYVVDMDYAYHEPPRFQKECSVCFAGAVMAKTCGLSINETGDDLLNGKNINHFAALDRIRNGDIVSAITRMYGVKKDSIVASHGLNDRVDVIPYSENPLQFKSSMHGIVARLRFAGL